MESFFEGTFSIRIATPKDSDAVSALLVASYSTLLAPCYNSDMLAGALPHMTKANPTLLACGTYYVADTEPGNLASRMRRLDGSKARKRRDH